MKSRVPYDGYGFHLFEQNNNINSMSRSNLYKEATKFAKYADKEDYVIDVALNLARHLTSGNDIIPTTIPNDYPRELKNLAKKNANILKQFASTYKNPSDRTLFLDAVIQYFS